ncbi:MAG: sigma-70 family RNA polymerase sigma factor [Actinomycetia bacterium]|nr:sigma-70 family RNA polymerase sigma factor [Actinomycetes bacterium]
MTEPTDGTAGLKEALTAAQTGDEAAFESLIDPYRSELQAHCYRMLGSAHDAEDVMQEVLLRAWRALADFQGRSSLRTWLYRIATNSCLNLIESRSRRFLPVDLGPLVEDAPAAEKFWIEPYPKIPSRQGDELASPVGRYELRESLELAFVAALQYLPPNQRAALILRDVLGFSAQDAAEALDTTATAVNSALQHARKTVKARVPERSQHTMLRELGDAGIRRVVERYVRALEDADVDTLVSMLAEDATWSMPPCAAWYQGHEAISRFLAAGPFTVRWRHVATEANGQPAVACYAWDETTGAYVARVMDVLTLDGEQITAVTAFIDPSLFPRFNLPTQVPGYSEQQE